MNQITVGDAAAAMQAQLIRRCEASYIEGVKHDSRECGPGDLFVCIKGPNRDGHDYIPQVLEKGVRNLLISDPQRLPEEACANVFLVEDTVRAMGLLARWYLARLDLVRVAVTGSVGKTSTRDMICAVLNQKFKCGKNLKNYNNDIGLPISIFTLDDSYEAVVLEMGMSDFGEIDYLADIVQPQIGVITGIGVAHMENLGSRDGIFQAKMELTGHVLPKAAGGEMIFAFDDEYLTPENTKGDYEQCFVGTDGRSDYIISDIEDRGMDGVRFNLEFEAASHRMQIPVPGRHNAFNAGLAAAVGRSLGETAEEIAAGLASVQLTGSRLRIVRTDHLTVIDDTYNASPDSMKAALKVLEKSEAPGRRIAILGDMYELGNEETKLHYGIGVFARGCRIDRLVAVGPMAKQIADGAAGGPLQVDWFRTKEDFLKKQDKIVAEGDVVLVKASRGMRMEDIVTGLTKEGNRS